VKHTGVPLFILTAVLAALLSACASSATKLRPDRVRAGEGAFFGHVRVLNRDADLTSRCYVVLTDSREDRKASISLDGSGWVYSVVSPGDTYLSRVLCRTTGMFQRVVEFKTRDLRFQVPAGGKLAYFGHVTVQMDYDGARFATGALLAGALGGPVGAGVVGAIAGGTRVDAAKQVTVENRFEDGLAEYRARYGDACGRLQAVNAAIPWPVQKPGGVLRSSRGES